jgi:Tfp pilus assembly protein PilF
MKRKKETTTFLSLGLVLTWVRRPASPLVALLVFLMVLSGCQTSLVAPQIRPHTSTDRLVKNADYLKKSGKVELAVKELEEAHLQDPGNLTILDVLIQCYEDLGHFDRAQELYEEALSRAGHHPALENNRCYSFYLQGRLNQAESCFRKVLARHPDNQTARNNLGLVLCRQGREDDALALWREAGSDTEARQRLGQALTALGREAPPHLAGGASPPADQQTVAAAKPVEASGPETLEPQAPRPAGPEGPRPAPVQVAAAPAPPPAPAGQVTPASGADQGPRKTPEPLTAQAPAPAAALPHQPAATEPQPTPEPVAAVPHLPSAGEGQAQPAPEPRTTIASSFSAEISEPAVQTSTPASAPEITPGSLKIETPVAAPAPSPSPVPARSVAETAPDASGSPSTSNQAAQEPTPASMATVTTPEPPPAPAAVPATPVTVAATPAELPEASAPAAPEAPVETGLQAGAPEPPAPEIQVTEPRHPLRQLLVNLIRLLTEKEPAAQAAVVSETPQASTPSPRPQELPEPQTSAALQVPEAAASSPSAVAQEALAHAESGTGPVAQVSSPGQGQPGAAVPNLKGELLVTESAEPSSESARDEAGEPAPARQPVQGSEAAASPVAVPRVSVAAAPPHQPEVSAAPQGNPILNEDTGASSPFLTSLELHETRIELKNGNGVQNLARDARRLLALEGFTVVSIGNHLDFGLDQTIIAYRPEAARVAQALSHQFFPEAILQEDGKTSLHADIRVSLGRDLIADNRPLAQMTP